MYFGSFVAGSTTSLGVDGLTEEVRHPQSSRQPGSLGADFQWQELGEPRTSRLDGNWQPEQGDIAGLAAQLSDAAGCARRAPPGASERPALPAASASTGVARPVDDALSASACYGVWCVCMCM